MSGDTSKERAATGGDIRTTGAATGGAPAGGVLTIDLAALADNWRILAARIAPAACAAVVKADAYGLGVARAAPALRAAGARTFFVALAEEAAPLRAAVPDATLYVLGGLLPGNVDAMLAADARPVLGSLPEIADWAAACAARGADLPAALHVDTGMNRLGLSLEEARQVAERGPGFTPSLVMTHLACGDTPGHPLTALQRERFAAVAALFPGVPASLANSAGCLLPRSYHFDLARPGVALYGGRSLASAPALKPVVRLEVPVIQLRTGEAGESVGYGAASTLTRRSRLAILSLGYADGFLRASGASDARRGAEVILAGQRCPLVGRVSMDLCAIDITDLPDGAVTRGDRAVVLGDGLSVDDLAAHSGTIGYEVLTSLGRRYRRVYLGG